MKSSVPWLFTAVDVSCLLWLSVLSCLGFPGTYHTGISPTSVDFFFLSSVTFSGDLPAIHIDVATLHPEVTPSPWKRLSLAVAPVPVH